MMGVFNTYFSAIRLLFFKWQAWVVVFLANLLFALLIAFPFGRLLHKIAGHSDAPLAGLQHFDISFIADIVNNYNTEIQLMMGQVLLYISLYLLLNIFLAGGLIDTYIHLFKRFSLSDFLSKCALHFWRLFRLALYFIGAQVVVVIALLAVYTNIGLSPFELDSDQQLISRTRLFLIAFVVLFAWIDMVLEYAKVMVVIQEKKGFILPKLISVKFFVLKHFFPMLLLYLLCVLTFILLTSCYTIANKTFAMNSMSTIAFAILVGQFFLFFKVGSRLLFTTAAIDYLRSVDWGK